MDGTTGMKTARLRHLEHFHDHTLACEGGVTVHDDGNHHVVIFILAPILARAHRTFDYRRNNFQVRRVEGQRQVYLPMR